MIAQPEALQPIAYVHRRPRALARPPPRARPAYSAIAVCEQSHPDPRNLSAISTSDVVVGRRRTNASEVERQVEAMLFHAFRLQLH